jgi:ribosomal protein L11 methyltransferase
MRQQENLWFFLAIQCLLTCTEVVNSFALPSTVGTSRPSFTSLLQAAEEDNPSIFTDNEKNAASLRSITFSDLDSAQEPQLLCNFLMELGACSTSIVDADRGSPEEEAIFDEFDAESMTRTAVTTHVWNHCNVSAHFPASTDLQWIMEIVHDAFPVLPKYTVTQVENKDWVLHVQQSWKPIVLPPFCLRFPWHTQEIVSEALQKVNLDEALEIQLQGGIAFGTGEHPTTQLCLNWISDVCQQANVDLVLDYGGKYR